MKQVYGEGYKFSRKLILESKEHNLKTMTAKSELLFLSTL